MRAMRTFAPANLRGWFASQPRSVERSHLSSRAAREMHPKCLTYALKISSSLAASEPQRSPCNNVNRWTRVIVTSLPRLKLVTIAAVAERALFTTLGRSLQALAVAPDPPERTQHTHDHRTIAQRLTARHWQLGALAHRSERRRHLLA